ncbi:hypothetical protein [Mycetocola saprophilus]|uniref:hypothetical protein n=1 Tax=Mycetocola saprophilus TaxID=76636 RepID=UPI003BF3097D
MTTDARGTLEALERHFADLRDHDHFGETTRAGKERVFEATVPLLDAPASEVLAEFNNHLLLGTGRIDATGLFREPRGGLLASWLLSWPEQRAAGQAPVSVIATYGAEFHHPHVRGATVGQWPLNVDTAKRATELIPLLRSIVAADFHNLVYRTGGDWRIIPVTARGLPDETREHG